MDPVSAIGLTVSCTSLLTNIFKITSALHAFSEKFKTAELAILSLVSQLSALQVSTSELELILRKQELMINQRDNLRRALRQSLDSANSVISHIWDEVSEAKLLIEVGQGLGRWTRTRIVSNEAGLAPMKEALRDQIQAIHLLLSILSLPNESDQEDILNDAESVATLERVRDDRSSLLWLRDADSSASFDSSHTATLSRLSMVFGFDGAILEPKPYRAAVMTTWKKLRQRPRHGPITSSPVPPRLTQVPMVTGQSEDDISASLVGTKGTLAMVVKHDFHAEREDEILCVVGEVLISAAISNDNWAVVKSIGRLGGLGLIPPSYLSVISRSGRVCESSEEAIKELRAAGVQSVSEWRSTLMSHDALDYSGTST